MRSKRRTLSVFYVSITLILIIVFCALFFPGRFEQIGQTLFKTIVHHLGWFYMLTMTSFIVFAIWIGFFSPYKHIRLDSDDSKPEYSNLSWFAMLFSAGMGIGLVFWGIAEPLNHYLKPLDAAPASISAEKFAMMKSFLHWGMHPWANYSILGLGLAYMQYRKNQPALISSIFIPLIGEKRATGSLGKIIDILAVFATAAGMATSLGLGTYQINSGLKYMFGVPENTTIQLIIVVSITFIYTWTALSGVDKGIKFISNLNMILVVALLSLSIIFGPTVKIFNIFVESTGLYFQNLIGNAFEVGAFGQSDWYGVWTIFYWAWWIAWAPFTGIFIARISKGRTIKEFIAGVLMVPAIISFLWFSIFGAIDFSTPLLVLQDAVKSTSTAFFVVINTLSIGTVLSIYNDCFAFHFFHYFRQFSYFCSGHAV